MREGYSVHSAGSGLTFANGWHVSMALDTDFRKADGVKTSAKVEIGVNHSDGTCVLEDYAVIPVGLLPAILSYVVTLDASADVFMVAGYISAMKESYK